MALFNRKKSDNNVLPEVERYYDAEKRERAGLAWLLAIVSIAAVALVLIGAFFGGRWIYRKVSHTNEKTGVSTTNTVEGSIGKSENTSVNNNSDNSSTKTTTPSTPSTTAPSTTPKTQPTTPAVTTPKPSTATTPSAAPTTAKNLASTGPANTVAIFIISVLGFAALYNLAIRSRSSN